LRDRDGVGTVVEHGQLDRTRCQLSANDGEPFYRRDAVAAQ
jgi:hypothetical protein